MAITRTPIHTGLSDDGDAHHWSPVGPDRNPATGVCWLQYRCTRLVAGGHQCTAEQSTPLTEDEYARLVTAR